MNDLFIQLREEMQDIVDQLGGNIDQIGRINEGVAFNLDNNYHNLPKSLLMIINLPSSACRTLSQYQESTLLFEIDETYKLYGYSLKEVKRNSQRYNNLISLDFYFEKTSDPLPEVNDIL